MTFEQYIEQVKARLGVATPAPWVADFGNWQVESCNPNAYRDGVCSFAFIDRHGLGDSSNPVNPTYDAEFIAHAPTDLAVLIEVVDTLVKTLCNESLRNSPNTVVETLNAVVQKHTRGE